ncbi:unnamed protein product, partial [Soboliphyme baturini]|uniref:Pepdidase_M14_N domain-containing protein n=1 Tax=Soboliphyme baturini TaxID=241478 RepID=A0A183J7T8_9BILA
DDHQRTNEIIFGFTSFKDSSNTLFLTCFKVFLIVILIVIAIVLTSLILITTVDTYEYDLLLNADINQIQQHFHSYYFKVSNMVEKVVYTFNIINCVKTRSLYNFGMQPVVFSVAEALNGRAGWVRSGRNIVYYRNYYCLPEADVQTKKINRGGNFYTASFCMSFRHSYDICYFAYHYPYTYSSLKLLSPQSNVHFRTERLCYSLAKNPVFILTLTEAGSAAQIRSRELVIISARIHPGESNASWMMHGNYVSNLNRAKQRFRFLFRFKHLRFHFIIPSLWLYDGSRSACSFVTACSNFYESQTPTLCFLYPMLHFIQWLFVSSKTFVKFFNFRS